MATIGYARISNSGQDLALQLDALKKAGCKRIFKDQASGAKTDRPGLVDAMDMLEKGDVLVVWKLDRLGRSLAHLVQTLGELGKARIGFRSLTEGLDTTTSNGRLVAHIMGALAEFERDLIRERTKAGLEAASARGRKGGRPPVITPDKIKRAKELVASGLNVREAAVRLKISKSALYKALAEKLASTRARKGSTRPRRSKH